MDKEGEMRKKGIVLITLGILGGIFVSTFDIIMGKPANDLTGPKSIVALVICALLIIRGIHLLLKRPGK